ncbi:MAG: fused MFS/spermidine synthase [Burkholderiales bacterium]
MNYRAPRNLFFLFFTASGFAGLIYESIWSHYLKLFLGHAAYAQTLVLAIFMGGMAVGSWVSSRYSGRWKNLFVGYALVEGMIGVLALIFHPVFETLTGFAYTSIMPALGSPALISAFKWGLSALLIMPQSVLLGMTFPLMSAGIIRAFPQSPGSSISMLYFTNSLGAATGVLVSGFVLIAWSGLPGALLTAGLINIALALLVWLLAKDADQTHHVSVKESNLTASSASRYRLLLAISLLTGTASFIYEIGWIRMLNLVLGTSTHVFEIMLSAFIFGLAFGGLWIKRRIDQTGDPVRFLGLVQVVMGLLALSTLLLYRHTFDAMQLTFEALSKTEVGYAAFNVVSHLIALSIMFPAAFCAGMTLPLITYSLLKQGAGEKSIGAVYAANTVGAIAGVFLATHLGLPLLGLKGLITLGAGIDIALGLVLLWRLFEPGRLAAPLATAAGVSAVAAVLLWVQLDSYKMASGIYRQTGFFTPGKEVLLFHEDGKTATVDLVKSPIGTIISSNGKPDASINMQEGQRTRDEITMVLSAALPLAARPEARTAAVIGFGSGLTTHTLLSANTLDEVDTIEIEPAMIEAARGFRPRVERAYADPRSRIFVEDAKTFFSTQNKKYDIIISEPSNPWVSGVSSLFSQEFYRLIQRHLNPHGVLVQWFQLYAMDISLVASVMQALAPFFPDYLIYATDDYDILIIASKEGRFSGDNANLFQMPLLAQELQKIGLHSMKDIEVRRIGSKKVLGPLFSSFDITPNSDYFPILDLNAARYLYYQQSAFELVALDSQTIPMLEMLEHRGDQYYSITTEDAAGLSKIEYIRKAKAIVQYYLGNKSGLALIPAELQKDMELATALYSDCQHAKSNDLWLDSLFRVAETTSPYLSARELNSLWSRFNFTNCQGLTPWQKDWLSLLKAVANRDADAMAGIGENLLRQDVKFHPDYILAAAMIGNLAQGRFAESRQLWEQYGTKVFERSRPGFPFRLLHAYSAGDKRAGSN